MKTRYDGHTPGPWKPYYFRSPRGARAYWGVGNNAALLQVAHWVNDKSTADLIAASPDLLERIKAMYELAKRWEYFEVNESCIECGSGRLTKKHNSFCKYAAELLATEKLLGIGEG